MMTLVASLRFFVVSAESPVSKLWRASDYDRVTESHQPSILDGATGCVGHASLRRDIDVPTAALVGAPSIARSAGTR